MKLGNSLYSIVGWGTVQNELYSTSFVNVSEISFSFRFFIIFLRQTNL